jgi:hypothetical protein
VSEVVPTDFPPPPPPPPGPVRPTFDFVRPFAFTFEDPEWIPKVLLGGLFTLASFLLIGAPFVYGYIAQLVRNVVDGVANPLPAWEDLGEYFVEGLRLFAVVLVYAIPVLAAFGVLMVPTVLMSTADNDVVRNAGGAFATCMWCLIFPLSLAIAVWVPAALLRTVVTRRFGAAFEFAAIAAFIRGNVGNYLLAYVVWLIARFIAPFGFVLLCVGIVFTMFWSFLVAGYAFAQAYRLSPDR